MTNKLEGFDESAIEVYYLQYATAHIISFRDIFEVQCCRNLQES